MVWVDRSAGGYSGERTGKPSVWSLLATTEGNTIAYLSCWRLVRVPARCQKWCNVV